MLWRDASALPEELIFKVNYLGGEMPLLALNFSRPGGQVVAQYYTFLRLGREGFRQVQRKYPDVATYMSAQIGELGPFRLLTKGDELPVFAFTLHDDVTNYSVFDVSAGLRERGWQVPAYTFPADREDLAAFASWCVTEQVARWPTSCWTTSHMCCPGCSSRPNRSEGPTRRASTTPPRNGRPDRAR